jgi:hypothetical protein
MEFAQGTRRTGLADQQQPSSTIGDFALHNIALERLIGIGDWRPSSSVDRAIWGAPAVETLLRATKMRSGAISRLAPRLSLRKFAALHTQALAGLRPAYIGLPPVRWSILLAGPEHLARPG